MVYNDGVHLAQLYSFPPPLLPMNRKWQTWGVTDEADLELYTFYNRSSAALVICTRTSSFTLPLISTTSNGRLGSTSDESNQHIRLAVHEYGIAKVIWRRSAFWDPLARRHRDVSASRGYPVDSIYYVTTILECLM